MNKKYLVGDRIKFNEEMYNKLKKYLEENNGGVIKDNDFIIDSIPEDSRVTVLGKVNTREFGEELRKFTINNADTEMLEEAEWDFRYSDKFAERMEFNQTSQRVFNILRKCNCRNEKRNYFDIEVVDKEFMLSFISLDRYIKYYVKDDKDVTYGGDDRNKYKLYIKPIKFINSIFKKNGYNELTQAEIDAVMGAIEQKMDADFVIVSGTDITKYYNEEMYIQTGGNLNSSCMRYDDKKYYFGIYEDNAEMLILKDRTSGKIYGRALIWDMHTQAGVIKFMDRIYSTKNAIESMFLQYADEHGMARLDRQSYHMECYYYKGELHSFCNMDCHIVLNKNVWDYGRYPFLDTFYCCRDITDNQLHADSCYDVSLDNTGSTMDFKGDQYLTKSFLEHCMSLQICIHPDTNDWKQNKIRIEEWLEELDIDDEDYDCDEYDDDYDEED